MRVLGAFKMNPYEILELDWMPAAGVTESDIRACSFSCAGGGES